MALLSTPSGEPVRARVKAWAQKSAGALKLDGAQRAAWTELVQELEDGEVHVAFAGQFSSGKSSLLNALLQRELAPTGEFPETGCPCFFRPGWPTRVQVRWRSGKGRSIPADPAAIASYASLLDEAGNERAIAELPERVEAHLSKGVIPKGAVWIDTPGFVEQSGMAAVAAETIRGADLVVWVLRSDQFLTEQDQQAIALINETLGHGALLLAVNVFGKGETRAAFEEFLAQQGPRYAARLREYLGGEGAAAQTPVFFVDAQSGHGIEQFRSALTEYAASSVAQCQARRLKRLLDFTGGIDAQLGTDLQSLQDRASQAQGAYDAWSAQSRQRDVAVQSAVTAVAASINGLADSLSATMANAAAELSSENVQVRWPYVLQELQQAPSEAANHIVEALKVAADGQFITRPDASLSRQILSKIPVNTGGMAVNLSPGCGPVMGAAIAALVFIWAFPPFGPGIAAAIAYFVSLNSAKEKMASSARERLSSAGARIVSDMRTRAAATAAQIVALVTKPLPPQPAVPVARVSADKVQAQGTVRQIMASGAALRTEILSDVLSNDGVNALAPYCIVIHNSGR